MSSEEVKKIEDPANKQSYEFDEEKQPIVHHVSIAPALKRFVQITTVTLLFIITALVLSAAIVLIVLNPRIGKDFDHVCHQRFCYRLDFTKLSTGGDSQVNRFKVLADMAPALASAKVGVILLYGFPVSLVSDAAAVEQNKNEILKFISAYNKNSIAVYLSMPIDKGDVTDETFKNLVTLGVTGFIFAYKEFPQYENKFYNLLFVSMPKDDTVLHYLKHYTKQKYPVVMLEMHTVEEFTAVLGPDGGKTADKVDYLLVPYNNAYLKALFGGKGGKNINPLAEKTVFVVNLPQKLDSADDGYLDSAGMVVLANYLSDVGVGLDSGLEMYTHLDNYANYTGELRHHFHTKNKMLETLDKWTAVMQFYEPFQKGCLSTKSSGLLTNDQFIEKGGVPNDEVFGFYKSIGGEEKGDCKLVNQTYILLVNKDVKKHNDLKINLSQLPESVLPPNKDKNDVMAYLFFDIPMTFAGFSLGKAYKLGEFNLTLSNAMMIQIK